MKTQFIRLNWYVSYHLYVELNELSKQSNNDPFYYLLKR